MFPRSLMIAGRVLPRRMGMAFTRGYAAGTGNQGFASMDPQKQREIASKGGRTTNAGEAPHPAGTTQSHTTQTAATAPRAGQSNAQAPASQPNISPGYQAQAIHNAQASRATPSQNANAAYNNNTPGNKTDFNLTPSQRRASRETYTKNVTQPEKVDFRKGDLVRYTAGANVSEGLIQAIHTQTVVDAKGATHRATAESPMAEIINHYSQKIVFHHFAALTFVARGEDIPPPLRQPGTANRPSDSPNPNPPPPGQARQPPELEFAVGDMVRYHHGKGIAAGIVQGIYFTHQKDEHGNFHDATHDSPTVRIENMFTKTIDYHKIDKIELVTTSDNITAARNLKD